MNLALLMLLLAAYGSSLWMWLSSFGRRFRPRTGRRVAAQRVGRRPALLQAPLHDSGASRALSARKRSPSLASAI